MPYVNCPNCGQKALRVATRCPQCGLPFESQFLQHQRSGSQPRRGLPVLLIVGAVAAILVVEVVRSGFNPARLPPAPAMVIDSTPPPPAPPSRESVPPRESLPPAPERVQAVAPAPEAPRAMTPTAEPRFANNWVNVRADPSNSAAVVRILHPGDTVLVDSLARGWYRVVAGEKPVGYVDAHYLARSPPTVQP